MSPHFIVRALGLACFLWFTGCGGSDYTVFVACRPTSVTAGAIVQCTASTQDSSGQPLPVESYQWESSSESIAEVLDSTSFI